MYNFDCFTNYGDPNTFCQHLNNDRSHYLTVENKEIEVGEKLNSNYNSFYLSMHDPFNY